MKMDINTLTDSEMLAVCQAAGERIGYGAVEKAALGWDAAKPAPDDPIPPSDEEVAFGKLPWNEQQMALRLLNTFKAAAESEGVPA